MATIQERTSKKGITTYSVGYYTNGKFKYTPTLATREGAEQIKHIIENQGHDVALQLLEAQHLSDKLTLADWFEKHLAMAAIKATEGTIHDYERIAARSWLPRLGHMPLDMITRQDVVDYVSWHMKQPNKLSEAARAKAKREGRPLPAVRYLKPKSIRNAHGLLSAVLQSAVEAGHIDKNVAKGVPLPEDDHEEEKEIFTRDEWDRFYEAMDDHYKPFVAFMLVTGCRIGEATAVQVRDLNLETKTVAIIRAWKKGKGQQKVLGTPKSRRSRRHVMLPDWAVELFAEHAKGKARDDLQPKKRVDCYHVLLHSYISKTMDT